MAEMTLVGLRVVHEVARQGSFSAAALSLGYTQSAVSRQVGAMESPTGYLFRVGLNLHRKRLRRLAVAAKHVVRGDDHVPDPAEAIADHRRVLDGLATLPDGQRAAIVLVDFLGLESAEAGEVLGIEAVSVRARVHRARAALRDLLEEHDDA